MLKSKYLKGCILASMLIFSLIVIVDMTSTVKAASAPHEFNGFANDTSGALMPNGVEIRAMVVDVDGSTENYTTTVDNSLIGKNYDIQVEDPEEDNEGRPIYFFINNINTTNDSVFNIIAPQFGFTNDYLLNIDDVPEITNNSATTGTTGDSFTFNATVTDIVTEAANLTVSVNWTHNGTTSNQSMTNTYGDFFELSVSLGHSINDMTFTIWVNDTSGNGNSSGPHSVTVTDNDVPESSVDSISGYWKNASDNPLAISVTATDNIGLKNVSLYYYYSSDNDTWSTSVQYGSTNTTPWAGLSWSFNFNNGSGFYRFYSVAIDNASLTENATASNDTQCGYDATAPTSYVDAISTYWQTSSPLAITATASDSHSGVANVTLYYRFSTDNSTWGSWMQNTTDSFSPYSWSFSFPNGSGYYQFYSVAVDNASNVEAAPGGSGDALCGYDIVDPSSSVDTISTFWQTSSLTITSSTASDSLSGLDYVNLYYYYSSDNDTFEGPTYFGSDIDPWVSVSWDFDFSDGSGYYRFYSRAVDNATNTEGIPVANDTYCGYDPSAPGSSVDAISGYWKVLSDNPLSVAVTASDTGVSGVASVSLYYRFSSDNFSSDVGGWVTFGSADTGSPYSWDFTFDNDSGYYQFYSIAVDNASNAEAAPGGSGDALCGYDTSAPTTEINDVSTYWNTTGSISLTATATDVGPSDVANVTLYYRWSNDNSTWGSWMTNTTDSESPYSWDFTCPNSTGYYEFYSRGYDNAGNQEDAPAADGNDTIAGYDNTAPSSSINNQTAGYYSYFQNDSSLTITATVNTSSETNRSGLSSVSLYYWHHNATDNSTKEGNIGYWNGSFLYGTNSTPWIDTSSVTWTFSFLPNGTGYYRFCSVAYDNATNAETLLNLNQTNSTEVLYNNTPPNIPSSPSPSNAATGQSRSPTLSWNGGDPDANDTVTSDVYFGTNSTPNSGDLVSSNQSATTLARSGLGYSTTYYWKIISWDNHNATTAGPIWHFTTASQSSGNNGGGSTGGGDFTAPTAPSNVRCTSSTNDNTPSFAWDASTDAGGISGYHVKIDDGDETSVGDVLTYDWPSVLSDGTYTFSVKAEDTSGNKGDYGSCNFTIDTTGGETAEPPVADAGGPYSGLTYENITFNGSASTDDESIENYTWDFGDGNVGYGEQVVHSYNTSGEFNVTLTVTDSDGLTDTNITTANISQDTDADGYSDELEESYGTNAEDSEDIPGDTDGDGIPDDSSPTDPEKYPGDPDDDNDGVDDETEELIGTDPKKQDITVKQIGENTYYLIDTDGDGIPDRFYNTATGNDVTIQKQADGTILIDEDGDGVWDYQYDPSEGAVTVYTEEPSEPGGIPWFVYVIIVIAIIILIIFALFKTGYLYVEEAPEKPKPKDTKPEPKKKSTGPKKKK